MTARDIVTALQGRWHGSYGMCLCPAHDDGKNPSLSIKDGEKGVVVKCHAGCDQRAVIDALRDRHLWAGKEEREPRQAPAPKRRKPEPDLSAAARDIWARARPIEKTIAADYLRNRAISIELPCSLRYGIIKYAPSGLMLPAMIAAVQSGDRKIVAIHRTYLTMTGSAKAQVSSPKMALGPLGDGAVRLAAAGDVLGIAEGIETGLSAMELFGVPVWCALGSRLDQLALPDAAHRIIIFADAGDAGAAAAARAEKRLERSGRTIEIRAPERGDWNDVLQNQRGAA